MEANAFENEKISNDSIGITINSQIVKENIKFFAEQNVAFYLDGYVNFLEGRKINTGEYSLENPFELINENGEEKTVVFPITLDHQIVYTMFVNELADGTITAKITQTLVDKLNEANSKEESTSLTFFEKNGDILCEENGKIDDVYVNPDKDYLNEQVSDEVLLNEKDSMDLEEIQFDKELPIEAPKTASNLTRGITNNPTMTLINWFITETQGPEPWCAAYAVTMILNNKNDKRTTKVSDIVNWGKKNANNGGKDGFTENEMIRYATTRGGYPKFVNRVLSKNEIYDQLLKSNAVYARWYRGKISDKNYHALDIIGIVKQPIWNQITGQNVGYIVWNPWYDYTEMVSANDPNNISYSIPGRTYKWWQTVTNW